MRDRLKGLIIFLALLGLWLLPARPVSQVASANVEPLTLDTTRPASEVTTPVGGWSFRNHVIPVLTRLGCNSGACHGALAGKGGFKLTLRGYDPEADYNVMTRQTAGRRINLMEPTRSLLLLKPTMKIGHGGGERLTIGSLEYRVLSEWIAGGGTAPVEGDPRITALEVTPRQLTLATGATAQLHVIARYSDGHREDVTRWVKYSTANAAVAGVV